MIPVFYMRNTTGFVHWMSWDVISSLWDTVHGVSGNPTVVAVPATFALNRAYPNPARTQATINFQLPKAGAYSMKVYNIAGQMVRTISGNGSAGINTVNLSTRNMANGVYFYNLSAGGNTATRKLTVVR